MGQTGPVPRAGSTVLPPLQRIKTGPQSPEHVLQFCPLFRESSQDHSPQSMFYSSAPFSENQDRTTVPRACPTVLPPLQRNQTGPQSPEHVLHFCPLFRESRQDLSPLSTLHSSAPSSEKPDRPTVPRAGYTLLPPLQRIKTGPQSPKHVLQFCPLFRETRRQQWLHGATQQERLWCNIEDLLKTTTFIQTTGLTVSSRTLLERRRRRRIKSSALFS